MEYLEQMTTLAQLARDCAPQLARFMPVAAIKPAVLRTKSGDYFKVWMQKKRQRFYDRGLTCLGTERKLNRLPKPATVFFAELGARLGISSAAARCRYYRKQIAPDVLREVGK